MEVHHDKAEELTQVQTSNHLLKGLLTRARRVLVNDDVVLGTGQNLVLVVKSTPFTVDSHRGVRREVHVCQLGNRAAVLHVGSIAAGAENAANLHLGVGVGRSDQGTSSVIDQSRDLDRDSLYIVSDHAETPQLL